MNTQRCAVLMDVRGIQDYIFGSNKLRENLGASYWVENIFESPLQNTIKELGIEMDNRSWKEEPAKQDAANQIGYIGGGNALLLFKDSETAQNFIRHYTKQLLVETPGINVAIAIDDQFDILNEKFYDKKKALFSQLAVNKNRFSPQTVLQRHGITAECNSSGLSLDVWTEKGAEDERKYVSALTNAKLTVVEDAVNDLIKKHQNILDQNSTPDIEYRFINDIEKLGQTKHADNYIAIVHIDGNGMGKNFLETRTLEEIRILSKSVKAATDSSFQEILNTFFENLSEIDRETGLCSENRTTYLPIRPIIIGGDDITFVCPGKLGIYFAKVFLESFEKQDVTTGTKQIAIDACAGIAITKTKYPFYQGYTLAEALCKSAKGERKKEKRDGSWIDFHIAYGGISGNLQTIREHHYKVVQGNLLMRPYPLKGLKNESFYDLISNAGKLSGISKNRRKEIRKLLSYGENITKAYMRQLDEKGVNFKALSVNKVFHERFFDFPKNGKTPYFDMVELAEFYPEFELKKMKGDENG